VSWDSLGRHEGNGSALVAGLADVWAERDAARMRELDEQIKAYGRCRFCGHRLATSTPSSRGVCYRKPCRQAAQGQTNAKREEG
jgi:hypothetical protein